MSDLHKAAMQHGQLDPRAALKHARTMVRYVDSFNNQKFSPALDSVDRQNLAVALDNLQETAAMLLNMAERVPLREALAAPVVPPGYALVPVQMVLDEASTRFIHQFTAPSDDGEHSEIRLLVGDGHAGHGLYACLDEYPEEGAEIVCSFAAAPKPKEQTT